MEINDEFMKILTQDKGYCHVQKGPGSEAQKKAKRLCCEYNKTSPDEEIEKNLWIGIDCLNLFGISNVGSYYWVTDVTNRQWAVPNYLTGRQINGILSIEF